MCRFTTALALCMIAGAFAVRSEAQTAGLGLRPMRLEMEALPGQEKTASFTIEAPPSESPVSGRLILSLSDWRIAEDTSVTYHDPGSQPNSAAAWITFSPTDLTIVSNQNRLVRVTARVPESAQPGVYTSALFVQERPPVTPPKRGQQLLYFRYRYVVTVYVIVAPVTRQGELTDLRFISDARGDRIECELTNTGSRHLRPYVTWFIRSGDREIVAIKDVEASVLLPSLKTRETLVLHEPLPAGEYEVEVQVDFHDGRPIQSMKRGIAGEISSLK